MWVALPVFDRPHCASNSENRRALLPTELASIDEDLNMEKSTRRSLQGFAVAELNGPHYPNRFSRFLCNGWVAPNQRWVLLAEKLIRYPADLMHSVAKGQDLVDRLAKPSQVIIKLPEED